MKKDSLFNRIYKYRQREHKGNIENFLTETLVFCLESDQSFKEDFFELLEFKIGEEELKFETQHVSAGFGIPDILFQTESKVAVIEVKVESSERHSQLEDYLALLKQDFPKHKKTIVYLTKYFETKSLTDKNVNFQQVRWFQIFDLISEQNTQVTQQLKQFILELGMESINNFTLNDLLFIQQENTTIAKMDEVINAAVSELEKQMPLFETYSARSTKLQKSGFYAAFSNKLTSIFFSIGFDPDHEGASPYVYTYIEQWNEEVEEFQKFRDELLVKDDWFPWEEDSNSALIYRRPISYFMALPEDDIPAMQKFLLEGAKQVLELKEKYPNLFV